MEYETILRAQGVNVDFANPGEEIHERFSTFDSDQHQGHMEDITPRRGLLGGLGDTEQSLEKPPNRSFPRIKDL